MSTIVRVDRSIPGVRVVTEELPWCHTAAVGVWIDRGSSHEHADEHGAAHFLEHVLFKRTARRDGREISEGIDSLGGDLNAYTGREHTCYHVHVPAEGLETAVDLLVDVVAGGRCTPDDVEVERDVVLDELAGRADDVEDLACDLVTEAVLGDDPLGRPVIGSEESVEALSAETLSRVHRRFLAEGRIVVAAAGRVDHDRLVEWIAAGPLAGLGGAAAIAAPPSTWGTHSVVVGADEDSDQSFLALARRSPSRGAPDRAAAQVACAVLGGGLSSRLFQRVREDRGLAYAVYASIEQFHRVGVLSVVAGCATSRLTELSDELAAVLADLGRTPPDQWEVDRAAGHLAGSITLGLDDPMSRMTRIGRHLLDRDEVVPVDSSLARLRAVRAEEVVGYWASETSPWALAAVGPGLPAGVRGGAAELAAGLAR